MPANEETYRSPRGLHVAFAISSVAMTVTIVWMILADHLRPWKETQRQFHYIEDAKLRTEREKKDQELNQAQLKAIDAKIEAANKQGEENAKLIREKENGLKKVVGRFERLDTETRFLKAELDSQRSQYDLMVDKGEVRESRTYLNDVIVPTEGRLLGLRKDYEAVKAEKDAGEAADRADSKGRRRGDREGAEVPDPRPGHGGPHAHPEGAAVFRPARPAPRAPAARRRGAAGEDRPDQPARVDDQLQLQGRPALRPLPDLPPGHRPGRLRGRRQGRPDALGLQDPPAPDRGSTAINPRGSG